MAQQPHFPVALKRLQLLLQAIYIFSFKKGTIKNFIKCKGINTYLKLDFVKGFFGKKNTASIYSFTAFLVHSISEKNLTQQKLKQKTFFKKNFEDNISKFKNSTSTV